MAVRLERSVPPDESIDDRVRREILNLLRSVAEVDLATLYRVVEEALGDHVAVRVAVQLSRLLHEGIVTIETITRCSRQPAPVVGIVRLLG